MRCPNRWLLTIGLVTLGQQPLAQAQEASSILEEVIVSAQKRSEDLQDVPLSIAAIGQEAIEALGAPRLRDLEYSVPNLQFAGSDNSIRSIISIRGIATDDRNIGFETGTGVYIDGVYMARSAAFNQNIADVERVEVLRGPQGTLYGKNTIAGAINITTVKPSNELAGRITVRGGNLGMQEAAAYVSGPLIEDRVAMKVSGFSSKRNGYVDNVLTGHENSNRDEYGGRIQLRVTPSDKLDILFTADASRDRSRFVEGEVLEPQDPDAGFAPGEYSINESDSEATRKLSGASLQVDYRLGDHTLTSLTAYRKFDTDAFNDGDFSPAPILDITFLDDADTFSQELRIASPTDGPLDYVVGLYYSDQTANTNRPIALLGGGIDDYRNFGAVDTRAYALFANVSYAMSQRLGVFAGVRYNREEKKLHFSQDGTELFGLPDIPSTDPTNPIPPFVDRLDDTDVSPTLGLKFTFSDDVNAYARIARGYKSGGWNADFLFPEDSNRDGVYDVRDIRFSPEEVVNYELGLKALLFGHRLRSNLAVFYMDYKNLQVSTFNSDCGCRKIDDAKARSSGAELELQAVLAPGLDLSIGLGYVDATFTANPPGGDVPIDGNRLPQSSKWSGNAAFDYTHALGSSGDAIVGLSYSYRGDYFTSKENEAASLVDSYAIVNARLGWRSQDERWEVFAFARNLLDERYLVDRFEETLLFPQLIATYGQPRTYGLQVSAQF